MVRRKLQNISQKAPNLMDLWYAYLRNVSADAGILNGSTNYEKFIILGTARTGSNLLRGLLNSHRHVIAFGEIFRHKDTIGWDFAHLPQPDSMLSLFQNDPVKFLETRVFGHFPRHIAAVGFKIFYYHAHDDAWEPLWTYLVKQEEIKVIHMKRRNMLRTHLSRKRAMLTDVWITQQPNELKQSVGPISLDYEECLEEFTKTRDWEQQYDSLFKNHDRVDVFYEDLDEDYLNEMGRIQKFLGVNVTEVQPSTAKQSKRRPLSSSILNYSELKEQFTGTPWEEFFT